MASSFAATVRGERIALPRQRLPHSRGFTLLEMLIVLAILAAVAAWTWPSMRRQMIVSELRDAGKQVRDQFPLFARQPMSNHDDSFHLSTWIVTIRHIGKIPTFQTEPND